MKKIYFLSSVLSLAAFITYIAGSQYEAKAYPDGIIGSSGSGGSTCSSCHFGSARVSMVNLTTDLPITGYIPDSTYNLSLRISSKKSRAGFNIKIENSEKENTGLITVLDNINSRLDLGELTHNENAVTGGQKIINFSWKAPQRGTGDVNLFAAVQTGVSGQTADTLNTYSLTFNEALVSTSSDNLFENHSLVVSPTHAKDKFDIRYTLLGSADVKINLYDQNGSMIKNIYEGKQASGKYELSVPCTQLKEGIYVLYTSINGKTRSDKVLISK